MTAVLRDLVFFDGLRFSAVFRVLTWFREIGVELLDERVLIAMAELAAHAVVACLLRVVGFERSLLTILVPVLVHE